MGRVVNVAVGQDRLCVVGNATCKTLLLMVHKVSNRVELQ
jgi:hypothetical protein